MSPSLRHYPLRTPILQQRPHPNTQYDVLFPQDKTKLGFKLPAFPDLLTAITEQPTYNPIESIAKNVDSSISEKEPELSTIYNPESIDVKKNPLGDVKCCFCKKTSSFDNYLDVDSLTRSYFKYPKGADEIISCVCLNCWTNRVLPLIQSNNSELLDYVSPLAVELHNKLL